MKTDVYPWDIPDVVLLIGTDASGKDYVGGVLQQLIIESGGEVEKRSRYFSGDKTVHGTSENKSLLDTLQEKLFLFILKHLSWLIPIGVSIILLADAYRFRPPAEKKLIIVGHNCLRALAFYLAFRSDEDTPDIRLPWFLRNALRRLLNTTCAHVIVLDIEDHIRKKRIAQRMSRNSEDEFDRYMHRDGERSERIEACLVRLVRDTLGGTLLENNDLSHDQIVTAMRAGFSKKMG